MTFEAQHRSGDRRADSDLIKKLRAAANLASSMSEGSHGSSTSSPVPISWQGAAPKPTLLLRRSYCITVMHQITDCLQQPDLKVLANLKMSKKNGGIENWKGRELSNLRNLMTVQKQAIFITRSCIHCQSGLEATSEHNMMQRYRMTLWRHCWWLNTVFCFTHSLCTCLPPRVQVHTVLNTAIQSFIL